MGGLTLKGIWRKLVWVAALAVVIGAHPALAQEAEVRAAVDQIFRGMHTANADMVRAVFSSEARFSVLDRRADPRAIRSRPVDGWLDAIDTSEGKWDEQVYDVQVLVDGEMASVWAPYTFYLDGAISHCGINSIELLRDADGWKVTQLSDTRSEDGCPDPLGARSGTMSSQSSASTSDPHKASDALRVGLALQRYTARPGADEISTAPDLLRPGVEALMEDLGITAGGVASVELTPSEKDSYGVWQRIAMADGHLGRGVAPMVRDGEFVVGLLGNCISSWGMLAGLQNSGTSDAPRKVGLIWIDAHGDFNTPETTLSGWLGGMPVSVASGQSLARLRSTTGLSVPVATGDIVQMGLRDVDPLEQILIDESDITVVSPGDMVGRSNAMRTAVERLSERVDVIYLHVDLDILDAAAIPGSFFETQDGPTASEVAETLRDLIAYPKVQALGIASFPTAEDGRETSMRSTLTLIRAAFEGLRER
jgi:arginase